MTKCVGEEWGGKSGSWLNNRKGRRRWMETYAVPLPNEPGDLFVCLAVTRDITERQRAEEALRRSEANYRSLVQGAPNGICRVSADGKLLDVNPALVEMLGYEIGRAHV